MQTNTKHTNHPTAVHFARQRGIEVASSDLIQPDTKLTVTELRGLAIAEGLTVTTKTKKADLITAINAVAKDASVDLSRLTPRQRRRVQKRLVKAS